MLPWKPRDEICSLTYGRVTAVHGAVCLTASEELWFIDGACAFESVLAFDFLFGFSSCNRLLMKFGTSTVKKLEIFDLLLGTLKRPS